MSEAMRRKALIIISSAHDLRIAEPAHVGSISTGFFLVELAEILRTFGDEYDFTFATPDGLAPQLDINGIALAMHAGSAFGLTIGLTMIEQAGRKPNIQGLRRRHRGLAERREREVRLLEQHLGGIPVSRILPNTEPELVEYRVELVERLNNLPATPFASLATIVQRHRDPSDAFNLAQFDFVHVPGGHAPMADLTWDAWLGETLHVMRENGGVISLICHGPVALASTWWRVDEDGEPYRLVENAFTAAKVTVADKRSELIAFTVSYPRVPGERSRPTAYADEILRDAGFSLAGTINPTSARAVYDSELRVLTGNGPQAIDIQTSRLSQALVGIREGLAATR